jgi:hypothetical protein
MAIIIIIMKMIMKVIMKNMKCNSNENNIMAVEIIM